MFKAKVKLAKLYILLNNSNEARILLTELKEALKNNPDLKSNNKIIKWYREAKLKYYISL